MSLRTHRIKTVIYAKNSLSIPAYSKLFEAIIDALGTGDYRNLDGRGTIEITLGALKEIAKEPHLNELSGDEIRALDKEIHLLVLEGKKDDDYITYEIS